MIIPLIIYHYKDVPKFLKNFLSKNSNFSQRLCRHNPLLCRHTTPVRSTHPSSCVDTAFLPEPFQTFRVHLKPLLVLRGSVPLHPFLGIRSTQRPNSHLSGKKFSPSLSNLQSPLQSSISSLKFHSFLAPWSASWVPAVAQDQRPLQGQFRHRFRLNRWKEEQKGETILPLPLHL